MLTPARASALRFIVFSAAAAGISAALAELPAVGLPTMYATLLGFALAAAAKYVEANRRTSV